LQQRCVVATLSVVATRSCATMLVIGSNEFLPKNYAKNNIIIAYGVGFVPFMTNAVNQIMEVSKRKVIN